MKWKKGVRTHLEDRQDDVTDEHSEVEPAATRDPRSREAPYQEGQRHDEVDGGHGHHGCLGRHGRHVGAAVAVGSCVVSCKICLHEPSAADAASVSVAVDFPH